MGEPDWKHSAIIFRKVIIGGLCEPRPFALTVFALMTVTGWFCHIAFPELPCLSLGPDIYGNRCNSSWLFVLWSFDNRFGDAKYKLFFNNNTVLGYPQATCRFSALLTTSAHAALPQPQIFVIRKLHKALNNLNPYEILCQYFNRPICKQPWDFLQIPGKNALFTDLCVFR